MGNIHKLHLDGLKEDRAPVFAGGLAVLIAAFEALKIEHMTISEGALREGLLYDMLGRIQHEDVRDRTVQDFMQRFSIDPLQAERVKITALHCFKQVRKTWGIPKKRKNTLGWACDLHELGLSITHDKHHLQGAHILQFADMPGFARRRQHWLAVLVKGHRKKIEPELLETLPQDERNMMRYLMIVLRLSVLLHRSRLDEDILPDIECSSDSLHLKCLNSEEKALIEADLLQEKSWLEKSGFKLFFS
jgi:exopolyphosphatase/guanosine-5'-triphosphate,3'-diphosphate pyrophosphatase